MAYIVKKGKTCQVRQGNTGKLLKSFRGKDCEKKANAEVKKLHKKNKPKAKNRGATAKKQQEKKK